MIAIHDQDQRLHFRDLLRDSRGTALNDAEGFQAVVIALERLGSFLSPGHFGLFNLEEVIATIATASPLSVDVPAQWPEYHQPFRRTTRSYD